MNLENERKKAGVDISPYLGTIVTVVIAFGGTYAMMSSRLTKLETMIADLRRDVERHNNIVERTFKLESDMNTAYKHIDRLREQDEKIEAKIEKLHEKE